MPTSNAFMHPTFELIIIIVIMTITSVAHGIINDVIKFKPPKDLWVPVTAVARVRGDPPLLQSAMDILWRLRFSRLRQAPSRKAWYSRGPVKSKIIASYVHENFYLWYFILPQIMVFPCSINITARLACTNNHTCSTDSLARLIIGFKSTK